MSDSFLTNDETLSDSELENHLLSLGILILPIILQDLIRQGHLDATRVNDTDYVRNMLHEHLDELVHNINWVTGIDEGFMNSAREAVDADRLEVAIVLIAVTIEHRLNMFYRVALSEIGGFSLEDTTEVIRNSNARDKTGWLLKLVSKQEMDDQLKRQITDLMELRNQIIHFKAVPPADLDDIDTGSANVIQKRSRELDFKMLLDLPERLQQFLNAKMLVIQEELSPDYKLAQQAMHSYLSRHE